MANHILVPVDRSKPAEYALEFATNEHPQAQLTILHVTDPFDMHRMLGAKQTVPYPNQESYDAVREESDEYLNEYSERASAKNVEATTVNKVGDPAHTIIEYADEQDIDQIVMGSRGRTGISRAVLGSVAEKVVRRASVPVTVVRGKSKATIEHVLVPTDGSDQAENALDTALQLHPDATITLLHVFSRGPPEVHLEERGNNYDDLSARQKEILDRLASKKNHSGEMKTEVVIGEPAREINNYAEEQPIDHIVMGSHGRDHMARILLGSVAERVVRRAPVPVTVVR